MNPKTAILIGATGLTGGILLTLLLKDSSYSKIKIFGRNSCQKSHPKIEEHLGDLFKLETFAEAFKGDVVFCCIGTTKAKTPNKETYKKIDCGIPVAAAKLAKRNKIETFEVISVLGADVNSNTFYNSVKGEMERDVLAIGLKNSYIFQPSLIGGDRDEKRLGEKIAQVSFKFFDFVIVNKYKMIAAETIAKAMLLVAKNGYEETRIESHQIKNISDRG
ncbi:NAD(P)H-binding protein [Patiriisocius sp. Uisw_017]|jgi:uncharacterized protein YbjT (DUF2867 family)|uniref:NAD(P)H-binding protein n=1 Tax=Patiriisocius sp. Uisw_017 TaxID=3230968 RepID=UPI0039EC105C